MGSAARRLCRQFGVRIVKPGREPGAMETACINLIGHLIEKHGVDNMVLTLRILTETHPANRSLLNRVVITAVNAICRVRHYTRHDLRFLEVFDEVDLGEVHRRAVSFGMWMYPT
jgi:hypothetical protein